MSLSTILREMELNRPNAEMDISLGNPQTERARIGLKKNASETLKRLKTEYRKGLLATAFFIVVTGTGRNSFAKIATSDAFGCFSADPDDFFKDLASRITPSLFGREGARQLFNIAGNILEDKALELDIESYNAVVFNEKYNRAVKSAKDFVPIIRSAITDQMGSEVVGINAVNSILDKAIKKGHSQEVTPIVLNTGDESFAMDLAKNLRRLTPKVFLVAAGKTQNEMSGAVLVDKISEDSVGEALSSIRNKL